MANPKLSSDETFTPINTTNDRNQPLVRISVSNRENDFNTLRCGRFSKCLRCGYSMDKSKAIFLTVQSPFKEHPSKIRISVNEGAPCTKCNNLPIQNPEHKTQKPQIESGGSDAKSFNIQSPGFDEFGNASKDDIYQIHQENNSSTFPPCTDCHLTVLSDEELKEIGSLDTITLMLEIPVSTEDQEERKLTTEPMSESGEAVLSEYPQQNSESIVSAAGHYANLPDMNPEAEAAYRSHLKNLVPCTHCKRTFNPDRIMVHENVCVERAKKRVTKIH